jgi:hypothetical protein
VHPSTAPIGSIIPYAGLAIPDDYLPCDGYQVKISDYQALYFAIGTLYDTGSEPTGYFSIPSYKTDGHFLQGGIISGEVKEAGLPNIVGTAAVVNRGTGYFGTGCLSLKDVGQVYATSLFTVPSARQYIMELDASHSNAIYGSSDTVQPPATTVIFLIKYL